MCLWRAKNGLTRDGFVKRFTKVLLDDIPKGTKFGSHALLCFDLGIVLLVQALAPLVFIEIL